MSLLIAGGITAALGVFLTKDNSLARNVEVQAVAEPGSVTIQLSSDELRPMSPGCGCLDPSFGAHEWVGMSFPSTGFKLHTTFQPTDQSDGRRWGLTAMSPGLEPIDWYDVPDHSLYMTIRAGEKGDRRILFSGRALYPLILTDDQVVVQHGQLYPYAALLPADDGPVELNAMPGSRAEFGSSMTIRADAPERGDAYDFFDEDMSEEEYRYRPDFTQRGPMIDVLGPTIRLSVPDSDGLKLFASYLPVTGFRSGEPVVITLRTPFAIRLIAHPASKRWTRFVSNAWKNTKRKARRGNVDAQDAAKWGPQLQGRFIETNPQPAYSLNIDEIAVPPPTIWSSFAEKSSTSGEVPAMLSNIKQDGKYTTIYQLPPVSRNVEVSVFGPLEKLESTALRGQVLTDGKDVPFGRGQEIWMTSDEGLATGRYQMTPLVSAGPPTEEANIAGKADVLIDGEPVNKWPVLPVLWATLVVVLLGLALEGVIKWGFKPQVSQDHSA